MGDDIPYMLGLRRAVADRIADRLDWTLDDFPHYVHNRALGYRMPIATPQRAHKVFRSEFDAA